MPPALARVIQSELGHEAVHVSDVGLRNATDRELWVYVSLHNSILISKDQDFVRLYLSEPTGRLIWVRIANCRRIVLLQLFRSEWPRIMRHLEIGEQFIEVRAV
jgi:predicted nuclease of predicted toxin-antitoxin system